MSKQSPTRTYCKRNRPLPYYHQNCRTPRHWKLTQGHCTTRPTPNLLGASSFLHEINPLSKGFIPQGGKQEVMKVVTLSVCVCVCVCVCVEGDLEDRSHKKSVYILFKSALVCNFKRQKIPRVIYSKKQSVCLRVDS